MGLSFHSLFSDKNISEGLYLEKPLDERKVRDSECAVYTASQPFGAGFFVFLSPTHEVRHHPLCNSIVINHLQNTWFQTLPILTRFGTDQFVTNSL